MTNISTSNDVRRAVRTMTLRMAAGAVLIIGVVAAISL